MLFALVRFDYKLSNIGSISSAVEICIHGEGTDSFPFSQHGFDEDKARLAELEGCLPNNIIFLWITIQNLDYTAM